MTLTRPHALCRVAWAYAKVGVYDARLMDRLAAAALRLLPKLKSTQQTQQQQGAAQSRPEKAPSDGAHAIDDVNDALAVRQLIAAAAATGAAAPLDPVTVTNLAWAYGELRHSHTGLMAGLASVFVPYKSQYDNEMVARLARSYAALGQYDSDMCAALSIVSEWGKPCSAVYNREMRNVNPVSRPLTIFGIRMFPHLLAPLPTCTCANQSGFTLVAGLLYPVPCIFPPLTLEPLLCTRPAPLNTNSLPPAHRVPRTPSWPAAACATCRAQSTLRWWAPWRR